MATALALTIAIVVSAIAIGCWIGTLVGLPGNWILVAMAAMVSWLVSPQSIAWVPWWSVGVLLLIAVIGEGIEFAAGALGVGKSGGSKRSAALAVLGSLIGAVTGMFIGIPLIPIPFLGSLIVSLLLSGVGACAGAALGERWAGKTWDGSVQVGVAAFWGRLLGTLGKAICGAVMTAFFLLLSWSY